MNTWRPTLLKTMLIGPVLLATGAVLFAARAAAAEGPATAKGPAAAKGPTEVESPATARGPAAAVESEVKAALSRMSDLVAAHDLSVLEEYAPESDVLLQGSEAGELAIGRQQLEAFFRRHLIQSVTISWDWKRVRVSSAGDIAWVFADGDVVMRTADGTKRSPYRMTGVLEKRKGRWLWRQFHGSEPAPSR